MALVLSAGKTQTMDAYGVAISTGYGIARVEVNIDEGWAFISSYAYVDQTQRSEGKPKTFTRNYHVSGDKYAEYFAPSILAQANTNQLTQAYVYLLNETTDWNDWEGDE